MLLQGQYSVTGTFLLTFNIYSATLVCSYHLHMFLSEGVMELKTCIKKEASLTYHQVATIIQKKMQKRKSGN